jgi:hypothetical protein
VNFYKDAKKATSSLSPLNIFSQKIERKKDTSELKMCNYCHFLNSRGDNWLRTVVSLPAVFMLTKKMAKFWVFLSFSPIEKWRRTMRPWI